MPLFEPYRPNLDADERPPSLGGVVVRPAQRADVPTLAAIEAARKGGDAAAYAAKLDKLIEAAASGAALILVAAQGDDVGGVAKVSQFVPPPDAPPNAAPAGWYLSGVIVAEHFRRRGLGRRLTLARLRWIAERSRSAYYFVNARNRASIDLHRPFGFVEVTRDFWFPGATFEGGAGILFRAALSPSFADAASLD